ncbi:hypothetical protein FOZ63_003926 [Perkinsus olseni]|uniref:Uncharacterized protein n=1 Tax=Perkinsus olseni TaxID=32597 RepID=A0A7J6P8F0_PEROL|nr:hypothetical protein FOZ60_013508 [Perkinsus olseni]KAF4709882.1 hypothetical protein FOZ63_003926 [Perkinsus olseni]
MANGLRSLSESQLQQCRLAFKFLDEERSGVLQVKTSLGHFTRLAGFCPREQQLRELMEKLENRKVRCLNFEKAIDVVGEELLRLGCHSMDMFDSIQEALKLLDASHLDEVPSGPPSDIVSLARLRSALVSSDDERSAKVFDRMLEEMGYSGDEEVDVYGLGEKLLGLTD